MKKKLIYPFLLLVLLLVGCSTNVSVGYMRPSIVNMGQYRNIAVASTIPYKGFRNYPVMVRSLDVYASNIHISTSYSRNLPRNVANYATKKLVSTLSDTGFFNILSPQYTDKYLELRSIGYDPSAEFLKAGYDAVMVPKIEDMDMDEYIWSVKIGMVVDENGVNQPKLEFHIKRIANIKYSITIIDCRTNKVVSKKVFEDSIAWEDDFEPEHPYFSTDVYYLFKSMINGFQSDILRLYVPSRVVEKLPLMNNKPKLESVKNAYELASDGNIKASYHIFKGAWDENLHLPSGYNAALLLGAMGYYEDALLLLKEIDSRYKGNEDVFELYSDLKFKLESTNKAQSQINGEIDINQNNQAGPSIYDYVISF